MELHATDGRASSPRNPEEAASMLLSTMDWIARTATAQPERRHDLARVAEFAVADALAAGVDFSREG
jgi:hypothetical protein